jgi:thioester reductase-like protein
MKYYLLTGGTGLLGSYLLRDCLGAGLRVAVLARGGKGESARQRVENLLARWEQEEQVLLSRPVVLEGDLTRPGLGLASGSRRWIGENCRGVIHNAARLTFFGASRQGEPWQTNVLGTRSVLDLCEAFGLREFHYVSTAYVCGRREGRILESELNVGQALGNDYERSKLEAEEMVRAATFLDSLTVYRPSVIVGDSRTGYASTFYGYYAMVKLAHTLAGEVVLGSTRSQQVAAALGLTGGECKNFVPVDWVSAVMAFVVGHPGLHGKTYHLTSSRPTPVAMWSRAIQEAVERYSPTADPACQRCRDGRWFEESFRELSKIYQSYWRDDPEFDNTNTREAASQLACPDMNYEVLLRMAAFAIRSDFGKGRTAPKTLRYDVHERLWKLRSAHAVTDAGVPGVQGVGFAVDGPGGGQWTLLVRDGRLLGATDGLPMGCSRMVRIDSHTFQRLAERQLTVSQALRADLVSIVGDGVATRSLEAVLQAAHASDAM